MEDKDNGAKKELTMEVTRLRKFVLDINKETANLIKEELEVLGNHNGSEQALKKEVERLKELVFKDDLTQILNRRGFFEQFKPMFKEALYFKNNPDTSRKFEIKNFSLLFIDGDDFKKVNDTYGHDEGDKVLVSIARALQKGLRDIDAVARFGGEEFLVVLLGANEEDAWERAELLRKRISEEIKIGDSDKKMTISIGVASLSKSDADTLDELIGYADKAMYEAKTQRGKNNVVKYSELT